MNKRMYLSIATLAVALTGCSVSTKTDVVEETSTPIEEVNEVYPDKVQKANTNEQNMIAVLTDNLDETSVFYETVISFLNENNDYKMLSESEMKSFYYFDDEYAESSLGLISSSGDLNRIYLFNNAKKSSVYDLINIEYNQVIQVYNVADVNYVALNMGTDNEEENIDGITVVMIGQSDWIESNQSLFQELCNNSIVVEEG